MRWKATVAYDGTVFSGWQRQKNKRTIQEAIETALARIQKQPVEVFGSGRTDAGVHALKQVFHYDSDINMDAAAWRRALNALLPDDISIQKVESVSDAFHARYDVLTKTYQYRLSVGEYDVFQRHHIYQYGRPLDLELMKEAAHLFTGRHDFTAFNATELAVRSNQIRTVYRFTVEQENDLITFTVQGKGFLRYMVRMLVAACIAAGNHKMTCADLKACLDSKDKTTFMSIVPTCGLYLVDVEYKEYVHL